MIDMTDADLEKRGRQKLLIGLALVAVVSAISYGALTVRHASRGASQKPEASQAQPGQGTDKGRKARDKMSRFGNSQGNYAQGGQVVSDEDATFMVAVKKGDGLSVTQGQVGCSLQIYKLNAGSDKPSMFATCSYDEVSCLSLVDGNLLWLEQDADSNISHIRWKSVDGKRSGEVKLKEAPKAGSRITYMEVAGNDLFYILTDEADGKKTSLMRAGLDGSSVTRLVEDLGAKSFTCTSEALYYAKDDLEGMGSAIYKLGFEEGFKPERVYAASEESISDLQAHGKQVFFVKQATTAAAPASILCRLSGTSAVELSRQRVEITSFNVHKGTVVISGENGLQVIKASAKLGVSDPSQSLKNQATNSSVYVVSDGYVFTNGSGDIIVADEGLSKAITLDL